MRKVYWYNKETKQVEEYKPQPRPVSPSVKVWGFWHEHLDSEPVWIGSKAQFKEECRKRDLTWRDSS